jgi:hypothetical protein
MKKKINPVSIRSVLVISVACSLLAVASVLSLTQTALADLPPRCPPKPVCQPAARPSPTGGFIELHIHFSPAWSSSMDHWQDLWTIVQWQDDKGDWHDVEGWQGGLDDVVVGEGGEAVGKQVWWVANSDLGKGPFRWLIYRNEGGSRLATSEPFDLPEAKGQTVRVEVSLAP